MRRRSQMLVLAAALLGGPAAALEPERQLIEIEPTVAGSVIADRVGIETDELRLHFVGEPVRKYVVWMRFRLPDLGPDKVIRRMTLNVGPVEEHGAQVYSYCGIGAWLMPDARWTPETIAPGSYPRDYKYWVKIRYHAAPLTPVFSNDITAWLGPILKKEDRTFAVQLTGNGRSNDVGCVIKKVTIALDVTDRGSFCINKKGREEPIAAIVIPDRPLPLLSYRGQVSGYLDQKCAARVLQQHIVNGVGVFLPVLPASRMPEDGHVILAGDSSVSRRFGIRAPSESEGFRIKSFPRGIAIVGEISDGRERQDNTVTDRGLLWGIYDFLERFLDCRFYFDRVTFFAGGGNTMPVTGELVPSRGKLVLPGDIDVSDRPSFSLRMCGGYRGSRGSSATGFYANHTHYRWARYYKETHPEYFWVGRDGKRRFGEFLCYSEPGVLTQTLAHLEEFYKTGGRWIGGNPPRGKFILFEPADCQPPCFCEKCRKMIPEGSNRWSRSSNVHWAFVNNLAREVKKRWPDKRIATLAYQSHTEPPDFPIEDNVDVQVALMVATTRGNDKWMLDTIRAWHEKVGRDRNRLFIWDYYCYPAYWTAAPLIYPHSMKEFVQAVKPMVDGIYFSPGGNTPQGGHFMRAVSMKLFWNPDLDAGEYLDDYCDRFFGPASLPMKQFYELCIERYEKMQKEGTVRASYVPPDKMYGSDGYSPEVVAQLRTHLDRALEAVEALPEGDAYRRRVSWMRDGMLKYNRTGGMYETQYGFIAEAEQFQKWNGRVPEYKVRSTKAAPGAGFGDGVWKETPAARLVFGQEKPRFSFYNLGWDADLTTEVRVLHDDENLYVAFDAEEPAFEAARGAGKGVRDKVDRQFEAYVPEEQMKGDCVGFKLYERGKCAVKVFCNPKGEIMADVPGVKVRVARGKERWRALVMLPKASCELRLAGKVNAQFFRVREARGDTPENHYLWSPRLGCWNDHPWWRLGVLHF